MKRSSPDYSTTVVEEKPVETLDYGTQNQPVLKLKRSRQALDASKRLAFELSQFSTQQEILQTLVDLEKELPLESLEVVEFAIRSLWERFYHTEDAAVRVKVISLLGSVTRFPGVNVQAIAEELIKLLNVKDEDRTKDSHKVCSQIFDTLLRLGRLFDEEAKIVHHIEKSAIEHLKDPHFSVRCRCLCLIGHLNQGTEGSPSKVGSEPQVVAQSLLASFAKDSDPRVRTSALQALLTLHDRGQKLDMAVYDQASLALNDDYEDVRMAAIKLVWVFSQADPERTVKLPSSDEVRLVDDAFIKIWHMVNDLSMTVRREAAGLLGSLHLVSQKFLEQTLDKKLMSHLKRKKTEHEKRREIHASGGADGGGWSTGRTWGDKAPEPEIDPEGVSLMSSGACGAFVHGLEDEFMEVRSAAVDSLCELAYRNSSFAVQSLDFLADMMNDEIESVRLSAINSLRKISQHIQLREDQLETLLGVLEDFSGDTREAVRELLCHCVFATRACLHAAIHALLGNLSKYPQDKSSIWRCSKFLGEKHQHIASSLVPELLSTHPFFATPEPSIDDPAYVAILILVFNATAKSPTMLAMFPDHTTRHYAYLRDSQPDLVPHLDNEKSVSDVHSKRFEEGGSQTAKSFFESVQLRLQHVTSLKLVNKQQILKTAIQDLKHVKSIDSRLSADAECLCLYLQCKLMIVQAQQDKMWTVPAAMCTHQSSGLKSLVESILSTSYRVEHTFTGLSSQQIFLLRQLRLIAHALQILVTQRSSRTNERNLNSMVQVWESFLTRIKTFSNFINTENINTDAFCAEVVSFPGFFESNITNPSGVVDYVQSIMLSHEVPWLELHSSLSQASAVLNEPRGSSDNPLCFSAGLTLGINVEAMLENVPDARKVRVQVVFPDLRCHWFIPKRDDIHVLSPAKQRLATTVILSHSAWSEPGLVDVSLVLKYTPEVDEESVLKLGSREDSSTDVETQGIKQTKSAKDSLVDGVINLCPPVQVCIMPKALR
ncbi:integrator complex subunit 4-like [Stylophora pistillata]|uniref:Integrator complex subunit 4 n=1 Tax=Stylophora pistillata TaxID=50429 RepID=A0A2B4SRI3_STYPI|nr:integrator complex subunit 4-like [Stylophora pistillata]PFX32501.1 Integrator complex subunit 4 [Stylophora pistillata]